MHELSLAEDMLLLIEDQASQQGFRQVEKVILEVGQLSHVEADAMRFCFASVMRGTVAEEAVLDIIETEGKGSCSSCGALSRMEHLYDACHQCGSFGLNVIQGDQVRIKSLEVV